MTIFVCLVSGVLGGAALYAVVSWWLDRLRPAVTVAPSPDEAPPPSTVAVDRADTEFLSSIGVRP